MVLSGRWACAALGSASTRALSMSPGGLPRLGSGLTLGWRPGLLSPGDVRPAPPAPTEKPAGLRHRGGGGHQGRLQPEPPEGTVLLGQEANVPSGKMTVAPEELPRLFPSLLPRGKVGEGGGGKLVVLLDSNNC